MSLAARRLLTQVSKSQNRVVPVVLIISHGPGDGTQVCPASILNIV
jgi:hypothetical protein